MAEVKLYTTTYCPFCVRAKMLLNSLGQKFEEINVEDPKDMNELIERTGMMTVPQIFINEDLIGGCDELYALRDSGELEELLK